MRAILRIPPTPLSVPSLWFPHFRTYINMSLVERSVLTKELPQEVLRTEGAIKVGSMMEERIFDFDRRCGSCPRRSLLYLCLCTSLLYPYSQAVIGWLLDASNPSFPLIRAQSSIPRRKRICISLSSTGNWRTASHVFQIPPLFPSRLGGRFRNCLPAFLSSLVPFSVHSIMPDMSVQPAVHVCHVAHGWMFRYRVIPTYTSDYLSPAGPTSFARHRSRSCRFSVRVSRLPCFEALLCCTVRGSRRTFLCAFPHQTLSKTLRPRTSLARSRASLSILLSALEIDLPCRRWLRSEPSCASDSISTGMRRRT